MKRVILITTLVVLVLALLPSVAAASGPTLGSVWMAKYYQKVYDAPSYGASGSYALWGDSIEVLGFGPDGWVKVQWGYHFIRAGVLCESFVTGWVHESSFGTSLVPLTVRFA